MNLEEATCLLRALGDETPCIKKIYIFGSLVKGTFGPDSDLDAAFEISPSPTDSSIDAAFPFERREWEEKLRPYVDCPMHFKLLDGARTPTTTAAVEDASILVYDSAT